MAIDFKPVIIKLTVREQIVLDTALEAFMADIGIRFEFAKKEKRLDRRRKKVKELKNLLLGLISLKKKIINQLKKYVKEKDGKKKG